MVDRARGGRPDCVPGRAEAADRQEQRPPELDYAPGFLAAVSIHAPGIFGSSTPGLNVYAVWMFDSALPPAELQIWEEQLALTFGQKPAAQDENGGGDP